MKTFLRATALTLSLIFVMTGFAVPFAALRASAAETGEGLGASAACEGHTLGTFSGLPACVNENGELHICENNFPDVNFRRFLTAKGSDGYFNEYYPTTLHVKSRGIKSLRGIEFFLKLTYLDCRSNQLTELDVSKNTALEILYCSSNQLTELDVTGNTALTYLDCHSNQLTELDVSKNTALEILDCRSNQLTELDVSKNTALEYLSCDSNQLTELDVSKNTALEYLSCDSNQLTELDVSKNTALEILYCSSNQFTELDLSNNTALRRLYCSSNQRDLELISKNGLWTADMSKLVSPSNFDRITSFSQGTFDSETGLLTFGGKPSSFTYRYNVRWYNSSRTATITVTVNLTEHIHSFSDWQVRTPASCTEPGEEFRACACGEEETRSIDPLGHDFAGEWTTDTPASCTEPGSKSHHCTRCEAKADVTSIPPLGHDFAEAWTTDTPASCTESGSKSHHCTRCEAKADVTSIPPLGHSFTNYVYDNNAACTTDGTETAKCDRCDATDTRTAAGTATGHTFSDWQVRTPASCTESGEEFRACACGEEETRSIDPLGHSFTNYVYDNNAACTTDGTETAKCDRCDATDTRTAAGTATGHSFSGWQVRTPASCTEKGEEYRACACGEEETRSIDPLGHTLVKTEAVEPTETSAGNIEYWTCTVCGKLFSDEAANNEITQAETVLPKLEHTHVYGSYAYDGNAHWQTCACGQTSERTPHAFGAWTVTKEPTYTEEGSRSRTCVCGFTETETLPCAVLLGDVNLDGKVTPTDYLLLKRQLVVEDCLTEAGKQRADINGDGALTPTDYLLLKRMILGL